MNFRYGPSPFVIGFGLLVALVLGVVFDSIVVMVAMGAYTVLVAYAWNPNPNEVKAVAEWLRVQPERVDRWLIYSALPLTVCLLAALSLMVWFYNLTHVSKDNGTGELV